MRSGRWAACVAALAAMIVRRAAVPRHVAMALCCAALAGVRLAASQPVETPSSIWRLNDSGKLTVDGMVVEDPRRTADAQRVLLRADHVLVAGRQHPASGLIQAKLPPYPERRYGDRLALVGSLETPREADRPGQFDYREYLARKGIFVLPDILANAGGVTVSYFEWAQNLQGFSWSEQQVNSQLQTVMQRSFNDVYEIAKRYRTHMRTAAYVLAIGRVADATLVRGLFP